MIKNLPFQIVNVIEPSDKFSIKYGWLKIDDFKIIKK